MSLHLNNLRYHIWIPYARCIRTAYACACCIYRCWIILLLAFERLLPGYFHLGNTQQPFILKVLFIDLCGAGANELACFPEEAIIYVRYQMHFQEDLISSIWFCWYPSSWKYFRYWSSLFTKQWLPFLHNGFCQSICSRLDTRCKLQSHDYLTGELGLMLFESSRRPI